MVTLYRKYNRALTFENLWQALVESWRDNTLMLKDQYKVHFCLSVCPTTNNKTASSCFRTNTWSLSVCLSVSVCPSICRDAAARCVSLAQHVPWGAHSSVHTYIHTCIHTSTHRCVPPYTDRHRQTDTDRHRQTDTNRHTYTHRCVPPASEM